MYYGLFDMRLRVESSVCSYMVRRNDYDYETKVKIVAQEQDKSSGGSTDSLY
jgi:hypothetical protein